MKHCIPYLVFTMLLATACNDKIDVNAPYQDTTVLYGLLSKSDTTHFIKINKAFLGESSANAMALVADSSQYTQVSAVIKKYQGSTLIGEISLKDTVLSNKEPGEFYSPNHVLYYFEEPLDAALEYEISVSIPGKELVASARTPIIDNFTLSGGQLFGNNTVAAGFISAAGNFTTQNFTWNSVKNARSHQLIMRVYYTNYYLDGSNATNYFDWEFPNQTAFTTAGGQAMVQEIDGESFYQQMAAFIPKKGNTPNLNYRKFEYFQFRMVVAADELNTYLEVNAPTSGVAQDKPQYTNVSNGIGIFSSRNTIVSEYQKTLNNNSNLELYDGDITRDLGFCATSGAFACP